MEMETYQVQKRIETKVVAWPVEKETVKAYVVKTKADEMSD